MAAADKFKEALDQALNVALGGMKGKVGDALRKQMFEEFNQLWALVRILWIRLLLLAGKPAKCLGVVTSTVLETRPPIHYHSRIESNYFRKKNCLIEVHIMGYNKMDTAYKIHETGKDFVGRPAFGTRFSL
jgi:hypothetical protein